MISQTVARLARRRRRRRLAVVATRLGVAAALVAAWQGAAMVAHEGFFPDPVTVWNRLQEWFTIGTPNGSVWLQIGRTLIEATAGFVIGAVAGAVVGILLARREFLADVCAPFVKVANQVPRIVLASLFVILLGLGIASKIVTVVVMVFFAVFFEAFSSVRDIDADLIQQAYLFGASRGQALTLIVIPIAKVRILTGLNQAFGLALIGALMGEYIGADRGLGLLIRTSQAVFDVQGIIAGLVLTTLMALAARWILLVFERLSGQ